MTFEDIEIGDILENKKTKETSLVMGKCKDYRINAFTNKGDMDDVVFVVDSNNPNSFYNGMFYFNRHNISGIFNLIKRIPKPKGGCTCDIMVLMSRGCKCGFLEPK